MANQQSIDGGLRELALFAGAGGGILGGKMLGWRTVCAVEIESYPASILVARQNDKILAPFPIWDNICTFDGRPWRGLVDVVSGGFPCQDISAAGKGAGITGSRSGLWKEMARIIGEVRPQYVFVENSPMLVRRGLGTVLGDLAEMGFDAEWGVLSAADVGAPHRRERIWILGSNTGFERWIERGGDRKERQVLHDINGSPAQSEPERQGWQCWPREASKDVADTSSMYGKRKQPKLINTEGWSKSEKRQTGSCSNGFEWWKSEPNVGRVANGVAARMDRLKAIGNGQVPLCAAVAWKLLTKRF